MCFDGSRILIAITGSTVFLWLESLQCLSDSGRSDMVGLYSEAFIVERKSYDLLLREFIKLQH